MKTIAVCSIIFALGILALGQRSIPSKDGFVPDSATAVQIARAVLIPVYGNKQIESEEPFTAKLENGIWTVGGTLRCPDGKGGTTTVCDGGTAVVKISKMDAHIISMVHYK